MINQSIQSIQSVITGIGLFERYGGLVRTAAKDVTIGEAANGMPITRQKRFPVSCSVTSQECWESGKYKALVPDTSKKSVAYWEELAGFSVVETTQSYVKMEASARFVFWLNIPALNLAGTEGGACSIAHAVKLQVLSALHEKEFPFVSLALTKDGKTRFRLKSNPVPDARLFDRYTYREEKINVDGLCLYPYEVGAMDFVLTLFVPSSCVVPVITGTAIDCIVG